MRPVSEMSFRSRTTDVDLGHLVTFRRLAPCRPSLVRGYVDQIVLILDEKLWCSELLVSK